MYTDRHISTHVSSVISIILLMLVLNGCGSTGSDGGGKFFESGLLSPGETFSYTFQEEGNVSYFCQTHKFDMTGEVTIQQGAEISDVDTVEMRNIQFNPSQITVAPNTKIVWINREEPGVDDHTVTSGEPSSDDGGGY